MNLKRQNISLLYNKVFALFLYIAFFGVQLFFNFDTGKGPVTTIQYYSYSSQNSSALSHIKQTNKNNRKQITVRLNKRFQPESTLVLNTISIKTPVCYIEKANKFIPFDQYIPTSNLLTKCLRGPPAVA
jgi:hypothetical protein